MGGGGTPLSTFTCCHKPWPVDVNAGPEVRRPSDCVTRRLSNRSSRTRTSGAGGEGRHAVYRVDRNNMSLLSSSFGDRRYRKKSFPVRKGLLFHHLTPANTRTESILGDPFITNPTQLRKSMRIKLNPIISHGNHQDYLKLIIHFY